ncbi:MAG: DUF6985 domain-containing protein [Planktomarina sp.]
MDDPKEHCLPMFGSVIVTEWEPEPLPPAGATALANFLAMTPDVLAQSERHVFAFYQDCLEINKSHGLDLTDFPIVDFAKDVWQMVLPQEITIRSEWDDEGPWYIGIIANITFDKGHGFAMYWENGTEISKVGGNDGNTLNSAIKWDGCQRTPVYRGVLPQFTTYRETLV